MNKETNILFAFYSSSNSVLNGHDLTSVSKMSISSMSF